MKKKILVGGQAVIEGVMMRVPGAYATAVRKKDGSIEISQNSYNSLTEQFALLKKPLLRGVIALFESLKIGLSTLQFSADVALREENLAKGKPEQKETPFISILTTTFALLLGILLFVILPLYITTRLLNIEKMALAFNLVTGGWRMLFFLVYLWVISLMKDIQRLFQYHGAEHKVVFTFESGQELTVANTRSFTTYHPRCGTSFMFIILLASILMYALIDTGIMFVFGRITLSLRIIFHLLLMPLVAGAGYELLKITARYQNQWWGRWLSAPGIWLQRITTKPPADDQIEVAIAALRAAFGDRYQEHVGQSFVADAVE